MDMRKYDTSKKSSSFDPILLLVVKVEVKFQVKLGMDEGIRSKSGQCFRCRLKWLVRFDMLNPRASVGTRLGLDQALSKVLASLGSGVKSG
eukprot:3528635-Amphidinium_carterae.1